LAYLGVNQNNFFLHGVNKKKNLQGGKPEMTYITGGKDLLTLDLLKVMFLHFL